MSAQRLSMPEATTRILEGLGLDTALRGKAALRAAREELGLDEAPPDMSANANLEEVAAAAAKPPRRRCATSIAAMGRFVARRCAACARREPRMRP